MAASLALGTSETVTFCLLQARLFFPQGLQFGLPLLNSFALRTARTLWSFGRECKRVDRSEMFVKGP